MSVDSLEHSRKDRVDLYITVVVDCGLTVCFQMERIDHIHIIEVGSCSLVSKVYRVLKRYIPDRECLEFCISGLYAAFVFVVELGETCGHLTASRARCCNDDERSCGLDIIVLAVAFVADDLFYVVWISVD